jgi:phospholipase C
MVVPLPAADAEQKRAACAFGPGALPAETLGDQSPFGDQIPIDHIVLVMLENRSFDHMLQRLPDVGVTDVDVAPAGFANPSGAGKSVAIHPISDGSYCLNDLEHGWSKVHQEVAGDAMTGFVMANETSGDGARAMTYQTPDTAPLAYFLGKNAAISDRYFSALQGPTWPNRMYFYAATSLGLTANTLSNATATTLFEQLDQRALDWRIYKSNTPGAAMFINTFLNHKDRYVALSKLTEDAAAGTLPPVSYVDPELQGNAARQSSQHPPANHQFGEQFVWDVLDAVSKGPGWARTAVFVTYDEHGGFYDHVPPPKACPPDDLAPLQGGDLGSFDHYGVRVPVYVVSPYAKKGHVSHVVHDHSSIVRFIETRFKLPALTRRDANADAMLDLFDFSAPPDLTPLALPPRPTIDAAQDAACKQAFPK